MKPNTVAAGSAAAMFAAATTLLSPQPHPKIRLNTVAAGSAAAVFAATGREMHETGRHQEGHYSS